MSACSDDDDSGMSPEMRSSMYTYAFNNGQVGEGTAYMGTHNRDLMATMELNETSGGTDITITLTNTVQGEMYMVHAHDAADPSTTPNGTPYDESPNGDVLLLVMEGNGGTASETFSSGESFDWIDNDYEGFFVVHDPLQDLSTDDLSTYLIVGNFAQDLPSTDPPVGMESYEYAFNNGQIGDGTAYRGPHNRDLMATMELEETDNGTDITITLTNTVAGETYMVHAHDAADPATTPNGTPYDESPNADVLLLMMEGNGETVSQTFSSDMSFEWITEDYEAFFVVHDPLQALSTVDLTTYLIVGIFGEDLPATDPPPARMMSYDYAFNNGQVGDGTAYIGPHERDLMATMELEETDNGTDITITMTNTVAGETYMVHAHDAADPATTPNGTPYDESPNSDLLLLMIEGNGGTVSQTFSTEEDFDWIVDDYEGFFVVHDPLQALSTTDLTTYLVVGTFAQDLPSTDAPMRSMSYTYEFNTGQLGDGTAYSGPHNEDLVARLTLTELGDMETMVRVTLTNTVSGEIYPVHAHDAADPATTPNGTPYDESPNHDVLDIGIEGTGSNATASMVSPMSFDQLNSMYEGFLVVHDPLQPLSTIDLSTYLIVSLFAD